MPTPRQPKRGGRAKKPKPVTGEVIGVAEEFKNDTNEDFLAKFTPMQQAIIKIAFRWRGISQAEIGKLLGIKRQSVNGHFKNDELQAILAHLDRDIYGRLEGLRDLAADHYEATLKDPNADKWIKYNMSRDILQGILQSKHLTPPPAAIDTIIMEDPNRPQLPGEKI